MLTRDANTWTDQIRADYETALLTAFCGEELPAVPAPTLAATIATALPSLQRLR